MVADTSISGIRVARELDRLLVERAKPKTSVNGAELASNVILQWADDHKIEWHYIVPGKPMENAFADSFISHPRDELLNDNEAGFKDGLDVGTRRLGARAHVDGRCGRCSKRRGKTPAESTTKFNRFLRFAKLGAAKMAADKQEFDGFIRKQVKR